MRKILSSVLVGAFAASSIMAAPVSDQLVQTMQTEPNQTQRVLVVMQDAPGARASIQSLSRDRASVIEALRQNAAIAQQGLLTDLGGMGFTGDANVNANWLANTIIMDATPEQIRALAARDDVRAVEENGTVSIPDFVATDVTPGKRAQGDDAESTWGIKAAKALEARATYAVDGTGVLVGILDTGVDGSLPELAGRVKHWKSFISDSQTEPMDDNGHGTHCAGSIGGTALGGMEIGMAPGVEFVAGKILSGSGGGSWEGVLNGMQWVIDPDGTPNSGDEPVLVSNSWGGSSPSEALETAVKSWIEAGVVPIFAAGNSGPGSSTMGYPGGYLESFAVGATAVNDTIASFSSRGPVTFDGVSHIKPDISAPGKDVTSLKANKPGQSWTISGTSMACPHVAGLGALIFQANPDLNIEQFQEIITSTSIDEGPAGKDNDFGFGRIDALAALGIVVSGGKVAGKVVDADGAGIAHAKVVVNETGSKIRLKADGSFKVTLPEGTYSLSISAFGFVATESTGIVVVAGEDTSVDVVMNRAASGTVAGTLTGAGTPVQGTVQVLDTPLAPVETDAAGVFTVTLPAGTYKLAAAAFGFESTAGMEFTVQANGTTDLNVDLAKLPPVLVVDDDKGKSYETYYTAALEGTPHNLMGYDELAGMLSGSFLGQYEVVVWFTGDDYGDTLNANDQAAIDAYLDMGGRLFVSGQDIGYQLKSKAFYKDTLGAKFVKDSSDDKNVSFMDLTFSIAGGAGNQKYADVIEADGGELVATYADGTGAGTKVEAGNGKVVYFAFGFEGIDTDANRLAVMNELMAYLKPCAEDMAARVEYLENTGGNTALIGALTGSVSDRLATEGADLSESSSRSVRRMGNFQDLR